ncbi:hypothetical protein BHM03_00034487 [Ensete ventricosum]|uniref:PUM-HD domain-containing protein n=1 Tax=Ensete ventricosum TaxID=4639 RepID=A0A445MJ03_ENSVE|nr:hypothetical protein BHM03_00034487 [Ensete ventricosum]
MAAVGEVGGSKKRKREPSAAKGGGKPKSTQLKNAASKPAKLKTQGFKKLSKAFELKPGKPKSGDDATVQAKKEPKTPRERRLAAKEMAETRKKRRKPNYNLEKVKHQSNPQDLKVELASLWEKMRCYNVDKQARSELSCRSTCSSILLWCFTIYQTCVKYCAQEERDAVFEALRPHLLALSRKKYAVHLVKKLLDHARLELCGSFPLLNEISFMCSSASKKQLEWFISSLHGHVTSLLRHSVGSAEKERGDVASFFLPARGDVSSPRTGEKALTGEGGDGAWATRGQRWRTGEDNVWKVGSSPLLFSSFPLLLPFFSLNRPSTVDFSLNRPPTVDFLRYRPLTGGPHTGNLTDRYVPPVPGGTDRNCKPWLSGIVFQAYGEGRKNF